MAVHDEVAPGLLTGVILVGSAVLDDWRPGSDIDVIVLVDRIDDDAVAALRSAHDRFGAGELGTTIDGPRLLADDLAGAPAAIMDPRPWTLDGAFHLDDECFELHPVTWLTLARHGRAVRGPTAASLGVTADLDAVRSFCRENAATYWSGVGEQIRSALTDETRTEFPSEMTAWTVLGVARLLFTIRTGDVISKSGAGRWIAAELPAHRTIIDRALAIRSGEIGGVDDRAAVDAVADYVDDVLALIRRS